MFNDKCNCGREARYTHFKDGVQLQSCNKYNICLPYQELEKQLTGLESRFKHLLTVANGLSIYREGTKYYREAITELEQINKEGA